MRMSNFYTVYPITKHVDIKLRIVPMIDGSATKSESRRILNVSPNES